MTGGAFENISTSKYSLDETSETSSEQLLRNQPPGSDDARIEAIESLSILGAHDGIMPDDLIDILEMNSA